jgi:16S rRNA (cytidine1402-2'-O)-methyltransferase
VAWPSGKAEACKASIPSSNLGATLLSISLIFLYFNMLYVVATPIGNLSDLSFRAVEILKNCDYILCEDSRHSGVLLHHYDIKKPLKSFHKFSESSKQDGIIHDLKQGLSIALISDAGTPGISDPGEKLIQACIANNLQVIPIPGACAAITALCSSGLTTTRFQFVGFLPRKAGELKRALQELLVYKGTSICYESPNRLVDVLKLLKELEPERQLVVARELTKKFEEFKRGRAAELILEWNQKEVKGEIVLMIAEAPASSSQDWEELSPQQHVELIQETYGVSKKEAIVHVAKIRGVSKRVVYNTVQEKEVS